MPKYLDLSAHYEVSVDELLGKKLTETPPKKEEKPADDTPKEKEVKSE